MASLTPPTSSARPSPAAAGVRILTARRAGIGEDSQHSPETTPAGPRASAELRWAVRAHLVGEGYAPCITKVDDPSRARQAATFVGHGHWRRPVCWVWRCGPWCESRYPDLGKVGHLTWIPNQSVRSRGVRSDASAAKRDSPASNAWRAACWPTDSTARIEEMTVQRPDERWNRHREFFVLPFLISENVIRVIPGYSFHFSNSHRQ